MCRLPLGQVPARRLGVFASLLGRSALSVFLLLFSVCFADSLLTHKRTTYASPHVMSQASGIIFGWVGLDSLLLKDGVYQWKCPKGEIECEEQKDELHLIYTFAAAGNLFSSLVFGYLLDRFGPRSCLAASLAGVAVGIGLLGLSTEGHDYFMPSIVLIGATGAGVQIALFHLSNLFPGHKNAVMTTFSGFFQLGFWVFLGMKEVWMKTDVSRPTLCYGYAAWLLLLLLLALMTSPDAPLHSPAHEPNLELDQPRLGLRRPSVFRYDTRLYWQIPL